MDLDIAVAGDPAGYARTIAARTATRVVAMGKPGQTVYRVASREMLIDVSPLKNDRIEDDLAARDFTVNAMAWDLGALALVDPLSGREDLAARAEAVSVAEAVQTARHMAEAERAKRIALLKAEEEAEAAAARARIASESDKATARDRRAARAEEAEAMASLPVEFAQVGIGGSPIHGIPSTASVPVTGRDRTVTSDDLQRVESRVGGRRRRAVERHGDQAGDAAAGRRVLGHQDVSRLAPGFALARPERRAVGHPPCAQGPG